MRRIITGWTGFYVATSQGYTLMMLELLLRFDDIFLLQQRRLRIDEQIFFCNLDFKCEISAVSALLNVVSPLFGFNLRIPAQFFYVSAISVLAILDTVQHVIITVWC